MKKTTSSKPRGPVWSPGVFLFSLTGFSLVITAMVNQKPVTTIVGIPEEQQVRARVPREVLLDDVRTGDVEARTIAPLETACGVRIAINASPPTTPCFQFCLNDNNCLESMLPGSIATNDDDFGMLVRYLSGRDKYPVCLVIIVDEPTTERLLGAVEEAKKVADVFASRKNLLLHENTVFIYTVSRSNGMQNPRVSRR